MAPWSKYGIPSNGLPAMSEGVKVADLEYSWNSLILLADISKNPRNARMICTASRIVPPETKMLLKSICVEDQLENFLSP